MIMDKNEIVIVGAAIVDVLVSPANESVFKTGSCPADTIHMSIGGDALNEATVLAKLGNSGCPRVYLETVIGDDLAGKIVLRHCDIYTVIWTLELTLSLFGKTGKGFF